MRFAICLIPLLTACYFSRYPVTLEVEKTSTYEVFTPVGDRFAQGTAWAVDEHHLVTAGHVCDVTPDPFKFRLISTTGRRITGIARYWSDNPDLCVIETTGTLVPLVLARKWPAPHTPAFYFGYPGHTAGEFTGEVEGIAEDGRHQVLIHGAPGASGSPVATKEGVIGVLVSVPCVDPLCTETEEWHINVVPVDVLRDFLADADVTPTDPPFVLNFPEHDPRND